VLAARQQPAHFISVLADEVRDVLRVGSRSASLQMALGAKHVFNSLITCTGSPDVRD